MNTLSWMIYAAEVSGGIKTAVGTMLIGVGAVSAFTIVMGPVALDMIDAKNPWPAIAAAAKKVAALIAVLAAMFVVTPSPTTIYMIAASEAGETVVTSPEAIEMMGDIKAIIRKRLKDELGEVAK